MFLVWDIHETEKVAVAPDANNLACILYYQTQHSTALRMWRDVSRRLALMQIVWIDISSSCILKQDTER